MKHLHQIARELAYTIRHSRSAQAIVLVLAVGILSVWIRWLIGDLRSNATRPSGNTNYVKLVSDS